MKGLDEYLSAERLREILSRYGERKIGVVGDLALDAYWYAAMTRSVLSRETPHFPRPIVREVYAPGAGANVAQNLKALGVGEVAVLSVVGDDWRGETLRQELSNRDVVVEWLIASSQRNTNAYVKPILMGYESQQEDARLDFDNTGPLSLELEEEFIETMMETLPAMDALIVADQFTASGVITDRVREALNQLAADNPDKLFIVDSRQRIGLFQSMVLKPNRMEATAAVHPDRDPRTVNRDELAQIGEELSQKTGRPTFVTLSEDGVLVLAEGTHQRVPAAPVRPPLDPVGAGDTFIAALAATLSAGATPWEAGAIANLAAGVTVEKLNQTGTASPQEILARYDLVGADRESAQ